MNSSEDERDEWLDAYQKKQSYSDSMTLQEYVESLLRLGKGSQDLEFKYLMSAFGRQKIIDLVLDLKSKIK